MKKNPVTQSAGGVIVNPKGQVVVVSQYGTSWSLPKGHIEKGENPLDAAKREILEETGIEAQALTYVSDLGSYSRYKIGQCGGEDANEYKTIQMFLFTTEERPLHPMDPRNPKANWVEPLEALSLLTHSQDRLFFKRILPQLEIKTDKQFPFIQVATTVNKKEAAQKLAQALLDTRLAACVQIVGPMESRYWWKGKQEQEQEWTCVIKSALNLYNELETCIKSHHPYETPEIIVTKIETGSPSYLEWLKNELK